MAGQPTPPLVVKPFAADAASPYIENPIPVTTADPGRASFDLGFPPLTMTELLAGGKPPYGQDMNGILYMLSAHTAALQAGQPYLYSSDLATAMGGYAVGTVLGMSDGSGLWINVTAGNTTNPDTGGAGWMPLYARGMTTVSGLVGGTRVLTVAEAKRPVIVLSGTLAGNLQVVLPSGVESQGRSWLIVNTTTGAFTTTVKTAAGTGTVVPQGGYNAPVEVYSDGANIYPAVAPVNLPIDQAPTPNTIPQRTNNGYLFAAYFNSPNVLESFPISAVFAETAGDGYHRKISLANMAAQIALSQISGQVTNAQVPQSAVTQHAAAILANAALTGTPTAPTAGVGASNAQVANTAFVNPGQALGGNGWTMLPNGLILQWGVATGASGAGTYTVNFPRTFPNACFVVTGSLAGRTSNTGDNTDFSASSWNQTGFTAYSSVNNGNIRSCSWFAIGN